MCAELCVCVILLRYTILVLVDTSFCYCAEKKQKDMSHSLCMIELLRFVFFSSSLPFLVVLVENWWWWRRRRRQWYFLSSVYVHKNRCLFSIFKHKILSFRAESALFKKPIKSANSYMKSLSSIVSLYVRQCVCVCQ